MGNYNEHEKYVKQRLSDSHDTGRTYRMKVLQGLLIYCDEHPNECKEIKKKVEDCIINLKVTPNY